MKQKGNPLVMGLIAVYLIIPLAMVFIYSLCVEWTSILPTGFTMKYYVQLFSDGAFWLAVLRSVAIAVVPATLTTTFILLVMYVVTVYHPKWDRYIGIACTIPYAIQGIILPISVLSLYNGAPGVLSNRILLLICTYCIVVLPYMYQGIKNSITGVDATRILEAAQLLGASRFYGFFRIVVPSIFRGIVISFLLSSAIVFGDFVIVNTIAGSYYTTAQIYMYRSMSVSGQLTSSVTVVLFAVTLCLFALTNMRSHKNRRIQRHELHFI